MKQFSVAFFVLLLACKNNNNHFESRNLRFPNGGLQYIMPATQLDSINFCLPLKDSFSNSANINTYHFLTAFNEPNLSLKGRDEPIFRLILEGFGWEPLIVTFNPDRIIIKIADKGLIWPDDNYNQLNELEVLHLRILERNLDISIFRISSDERRLFDSLTRLNPMLNDLAYYLRLYQKMIAKDPFTYKTIVRILTAEQYKSIIDSINASGYWQVGHFHRLPVGAFDGAGFYLEANTRMQYQFVQQEVGFGTTRFSELCSYLLEVAGLSDKYNLE